MDRLRYALIVSALFGVLLSAFHVERQSACGEDEGCAAPALWYPFPASRLLLELSRRRRASR